ncbi:hypothetical protein [Flavobacterium sp. N2820]|uniref:hypothetical protein n=1 Tax=Flavobacterium sp. N2820 TaxID=2986834 RepID=UPI002225374C|nr:hypothetical protein [Flavobacterium sp. N2820]
MPQVTKVMHIEITPEQFLDNCSDNELKEIDLLIQSQRFQNRINGVKISGFKQAKKEDDKTK